MICHDVNNYVKRCDVYLALKAVQHKPYSNLQSLLLSIYRCKNLSIDLITSLPISINWKGDNYNLILIIIDQFTKMVYYKPVKITIDAPGLAEIIINMIVRHHSLSNLIVTNSESHLPRNFGHCYIISLALSGDSPPLSISKRTI